ncbi:DUF3298 and DUF4163 domain-containing protein [Desulfosporosinus sp. OT]|uniref:DUF3298 and DUF4163 domain-containing protein n=1 Tax=Desulfosporosinus sp. OT TaxID=913865 RepID=UPI0002239F1D|nr:DUF3298 and DUF4163 domain-containing protein [Desulfosporosinus sp. OT]EGW35933.1 putative lipoprotein [Desulfosporosinus sp. OT]
MRKKWSFQINILVVLVTFGLMLTGCGTPQKEQTQNIAAENKNTGSVAIERKVHSETLRDDRDGTALLDLKITYPQIKNPKNLGSITKINEYYGKQLDDFMSDILAQGLEIAREDKEAAQSGGYEFRPHAYERSAEVYYNGHNLLSILSLQYENTGGAHPNSVWLSETFDVKTGKKLALNDILGGSREEALTRVYQTVLDKIKATEGTDDFVYQDGYSENIRKNYAEDDFILTDNSVTFYYQPYAIAAYAAGFPLFELPYNQIKTPGLTISELPKNQLENELYDQAGKLIDRNKEAYFNMFGLSMLKMEIPEERAVDKVLFPVTDERFVNFADFEQFVKGTYIQSEADSLLNNGKYHNVNGKVYGDMSKDASVGYYVNWNDYRYELEDMTERSATLNILTTDNSPAGQKDISINVKMHKENSNWLLEKMIY